MNWSRSPPGRGHVLSRPIPANVAFPIAQGNAPGGACTSPGQSIHPRLRLLRSQLKIDQALPAIEITTSTMMNLSTHGA